MRNRHQTSSGHRYTRIEVGRFKEYERNLSLYSKWLWEKFKL